MKQTFSLTFYSYKYLLLLLLLLLLLIRLWPCLPPQLRVSLSWLWLQRQQFGLWPREHVQLVGASEALQVTVELIDLIDGFLCSSSSDVQHVCVGALCCFSLWSETIRPPLLCCCCCSSCLCSCVRFFSGFDQHRNVSFPAWWPEASCSAGEGSLNDYLMEYLKCVFVCV